MCREFEVEKWKRSCTKRVIFLGSLLYALSRYGMSIFRMLTNKRKNIFCCCARDGKTRSKWIWWQHRKKNKHLKCCRRFCNCLLGVCAFEKLHRAKKTLWKRYTTARKRREQKMCEKKTHRNFFHVRGLILCSHIQNITRTIKEIKSTLQLQLRNLRK